MDMRWRGRRGEPKWWRDLGPDDADVRTVPWDRRKIVDTHWCGGCGRREHWQDWSSDDEMVLVCLTDAEATRLGGAT